MLRHLVWPCAVLASGCLRGEIVPPETEGITGPCQRFADADGDLFGDPDTPSCDATAVADDTDCDDSNPMVNPGMPEICADGAPRDDDCDPLTEDPRASIGDRPFSTIVDAIDASVAEDVIHLCDGAPVLPSTRIGHDLTLRSASQDPDQVSLFGNGGAELFVVAPDVTLTLQGLSITNGRGSFGGAIAGERSVGTVHSKTPSLVGTVVLENVSASENVAVLGGAVAADTVVIRDSAFENNSATAEHPVFLGWGGAVYANHVIVERSTFTTGGAQVGGAIAAMESFSSTSSEYFDNNARESAGAVLSVGPLFSTKDQFRGNDAGAGGIGGAATLFADATFTGATFLGNSAHTGGALFAHDLGKTPRFVTVGQSTLAGNHAALEGGALYIYGYGSVDTTGSTFTKNRAAGNTNALGIGGAVSLTLPPGGGEWTGGTFTDNHANAVGGGMYLRGCTGGPQTYTLRLVTVTHNDADRGGGLRVEGNCTLDVEGSTIDSNTAIELGGGVLAEDKSIITVRSTSISSNEAPEGAAIYGFGTTLDLISSPLYSNISDKEGPSAAVHITAESVLTAINADFGEHSTDNEPWDVRFGSVFRQAESGAHFVCESGACEPPP